MTANGMQIKCDRCGKTTFCERTGKRGDGWAEIDLYKEATGWKNSPELGDLCPDCLEKWENLKRGFLQEAQE